jgi:hypothetical protein
MVRKIGFLLVSFVLSSAALAQSFGGTYVTQNAQGGAVTLKLKQNAQKQVTGTLSGNGNSFEVLAEVNQNGQLVGTVSGNGAKLFIAAELAGRQLKVALVEPGPNGQPNLNASRQLVMTRSGSGGPAAGPAAKAAPAAPAAGQQGSAQDAQVVQFLTGNAWCAFSYNKTSGASSKERVVFRRDGIVVQQTGSETYSSGSGGIVAGQRSGGNQARWRARNGQLELSQDGVNWAPQVLNVTRNSNGYPIINANGKEYMQCS